MLETMQLAEPPSSTGDVDREENFILHEITAYLCPIWLTDDEKLSPLTFWKKRQDVYPNISVLARRSRVYLTLYRMVMPIGTPFLKEKINN